MTLRKRTLLTIGAIGLVLIVVLYAVSSTILLHGVAKLEDQDTQASVQRVVKILEEELASMDLSAHDWASWDETYNFVQDGNSAYIEENLLPLTLESLQLNLLLFADTAGQIVWGTGYDLEEQEVLPVSEVLQAYLTPGSSLVQYTEEKLHRGGIVLLPEGPLLVVSWPIRPTSEVGPIRGSLVMGRYLNTTKVARLAQLTDLTLALYRIDDPALPMDCAHAKARLTAHATTITMPLNDKTIVGYTILNDVTGSQALLLRVMLPRSYYQQGRASTLYLLVSLVVVTVAFGGAMLFFLERSVLRRISSLSHEVGQIRADGELSARVSQSGEDELARLAGTINNMIAALEHSQHALRQGEERSRQEALRLEALRQVGLELATQLDLDALLRSIVSRAIHLLEADDGGLYLYRPQKDVLERVVSVGKTIPLGSTLHLGEGLSGKVWETGQPLIVADYQQWEGKAAVFQEEPGMAIVGVPVRWGDRLLGILNVAALPPRCFSEADAELLNLFATQAAVALENARLFAAANQRTAELEALRKASLRLTAQLELQPVLEAILESALKLAAADDAHIFLYDGQQLTFGAALWANGRTEQPHSLPRPDGLTYTVARTGERLVIPYVDSHSLFEAWKWGGAIVGLPLSIGRRILGVMNVALNQPHEFDEGELRVLGLLADQAAIAIENARLYSDVQQRIEQLKRTQAQLIQSARLVAVGELAAGVAHQLNNSLTPILGYAELLSEQLEADSAQHKDLQRIIAKARQASEIVRNLLDFARQMRPQKQMADINEIVRKTLALVRVQLEKAGLTIDEHYAAGLDEIPLDVSQIGQVFLNLINNAAQAMPQGGTLRLRTSWKDGQVAIAISDTGPGMSAAAQAHLFEPFFTTKRGRIGLGLSVSLGIIQEHGGRIEVVSSPSRGTTFTVTLPVPEGAGTQNQEEGS